MGKIEDFLNRRKNRKPEKVDYSKENIYGGDDTLWDSEYKKNTDNENNIFGNPGKGFEK
jgi:hypothetical protein